MMNYGRTFLDLMGRTGGSRGKRRRNIVEDRQTMLEHMYIRVLSEMCIARFKWEGLPTSVDTLFLEKTLYYSGLSVFYKDRRYDRFLAPRASMAGPVNFYDNPTRFRVEGRGFIGGTITIDKCVPIWGTLTRAVDVDIVMLYAHKLASIDRTIEINSRNARRTKIVAASPDDRLTMANIDRAIERGDPAIFVNRKETGLNVVESLDSVDLGIETKDITELHILKVRLWNELMGLLGIDGANQDKKERLVSNEVEANAEQINLSKSRALRTRRMAAEQINDMFSLNVTVDYDIEDVGAVGFNTEVGND